MAAAYEYTHPWGAMVSTLLALALAASLLPAAAQYGEPSLPGAITADDTAAPITGSQKKSNISRKFPLVTRNTVDRFDCSDFLLVLMVKSFNGWRP